MKFNKINKIIIFGGARLVSEFSQILKKSDKYELVIFSAKRHLEESVDERGKTLKDVFIESGIKYYESDDINGDKNLAKEITEGTLGVAMGAAWVFQKNTVSLFENRHLLDFMGIDLPRYRGGAHYSWQILHRNKKAAANLQVIEGGEETFHRGEIIKRKEYNLPCSVKKPIDYFENCLAEEKAFLKEFLEEIEKNKEFNMTKLNESESSYYPFLSTLKNGLINWSWSGEEIHLFISAFDDPYAGAGTFLNGKKVFLKDSNFSESDEKFHPFTSGLVIRKDAKEISIATVGGLIQVKSVLDEKNKDIKEEINLGDRFFTPVKELEKALEFKAVYNASGLKKK
ncbi:MAG TPA: hypothetical protein VJI33_01880 [Candidatus Paceibacterota bacterium]